MNAQPVILVIDDVVDNITVLAEHLAPLAAVQFATSGPEGLALAGQTQPDLIVLDVMMPEVDGFEVCERLRADPRTHDIPVIFVTARTDVASQSRGLALGAVDFIHKPLHGDLVQARVRLHLEIGRRTRELQRLNAELEARVERRTDALLQALQRAEAAARSKSEFLAHMSHELRTPLNAIIGLAQVGERDRHVATAHGVNAPSSSAPSHDAQILSAGQRLLRMIEQVLEFARLEDGQVDLAQRAFDPAAVARDAAGAVAAAAAAKGLALHVALPDGPSQAVIGDDARMREVLVNLMANAVKFTDTGSVTLSLTRDGARLRFNVEDTGVGMSAEQVARLFLPFEQGDRSVTRRHGGAGLGLVVSRHLARAMGGDIEVSSRPGLGTVFRLVVTLPPVHSVQDESLSPAQGAEGRLAGLRVLAADDIEVNRLLLGRMLEQEGAKVEFAVDGLDALQAVQARPANEPFDVVLMDLQMPRLDGHEAARRLRTLAPGLPVVGLTAHALPQDRARCLEVGMVDHLGKPVDAEALVATLRRVAGASTRRLDSDTGPGPSPATTPPTATAPTTAVSPKTTDAQQAPTIVVSAPIDWAAVGASLGVGDEFLDRLAAVMIGNLESKPAALRAAAASQDFAAMARDAHSVKGVAGNVQAHQAFELARRAELAARAQEPEAGPLACELAITVETMVASARARSGRA